MSNTSSIISLLPKSNILPKTAIVAIYRSSKVDALRELNKKYPNNNKKIYSEFEHLTFSICEKQIRVKEKSAENSF